MSVEGVDKLLQPVMMGIVKWHSLAFYHPSLMFMDRHYVFVVAVHEDDNIFAVHRANPPRTSKEVYTVGDFICEVNHEHIIEW